MIKVLSQFGQGLLILVFRISCVFFLICFPIIKFGYKLLNRPFFTEPITQGVILMLEPLKYIGQRWALDFNQDTVIQGERVVFLLPAPSPPKKDINKATVEELRVLEGVGFVRALEIVEYRERFGRYRRLEELGLIRGVGSQTLKQIAERFDVLS